jgi:hypothetical protein
MKLTGSGSPLFIHSSARGTAPHPPARGVSSLSPNQGRGAVPLYLFLVQKGALLPMHQPLARGVSTLLPKPGEWRRVTSHTPLAPGASTLLLPKPGVRRGVPSSTPPPRQGRELPSPQTRGGRRDKKNQPPPAKLGEKFLSSNAFTLSKSRRMLVRPCRTPKKI